jgi:hypothetical protein
VGIDVPPDEAVAIYESKKLKSFDEFVGVDEDKDDKDKKDNEEEPKEKPKEKPKKHRQPDYMEIGILNDAGVSLDTLVKAKQIPRDTVRALLSHYRQTVKTNPVA